MPGDIFSQSLTNPFSSHSIFNLLQRPFPLLQDPSRKINQDDQHDHITPSYSNSSTCVKFSNSKESLTSDMESSSNLCRRRHKTKHTINANKWSDVNRNTLEKSGNNKLQSRDKYICHYCNKQFPRSANLTRHLRTVCIRIEYSFF